MKILMIGDITSPRAAQYVKDKLRSFRESVGADLVTVNAENASFILGPTPECARALLFGGADVLTAGNHTLQNYALQEEIDRMPRVLRPANYPRLTPGNGYCILTVRGLRVLVMSLLGRVHIEPPLNSPFEAADRVLTSAKGRYDLAVVDFHAEATGEKLALCRYLSGRVAVMAGTHTHVPTADLTVTPEGTGYVTDLGMCGAEGGILGMDGDLVVERYLTGVNRRLAPAEGKLYADGVLFTVDEATRKTVALERVRF